MKNINVQKRTLTKLPIQKTLNKYNELLDIKGSYNYISFDTATIQLVTKNETVVLDDFELFRFIIFNGGHYEFNSGKIICLGLVSKSDTNDIRIFFPEHYTKSSFNFFDPYLNTLVSNKTDYCTKLSNLVNYFTTYQTEGIEYSYLEKDNLFTVISKHKAESYDIAKEKNVFYLQADTVQFSFSSDTLKSLLRLSGK